ncbi:hypothetical protein [Frigoriglobus tundricola]|uniref:Uncharacterized protein n=1 Tax=Frigoriglobus tundricola TaxID=2774151 RepID=A0A6M5YMH9_9BACT|nr:hypothetical protein [Frigoriglobus tundricola]QJW94546.1 hypothetical protein FTUN_2067 [Frigoriglobus tundricola]
MRVLDEVAAAIRRACGRTPQRVVSAFGLDAQFDRPVTAREWAVMERRLECVLPGLTVTQGHWFLPDGLETVWDLVDHVARCHSGWERPVARTEDACARPRYLRGCASDWLTPGAGTRKTSCASRV